jgi:hypothetical protein
MVGQVGAVIVMDWTIDAWVSPSASGAFGTVMQFYGMLMPHVCGAQRFFRFEETLPQDLVFDAPSCLGSQRLTI